MARVTRARVPSDPIDELGEVVAAGGLHEPAAGGDDLARAEHGLEAEDVVAGNSVLDGPHAAGVGRDVAAETGRLLAGEDGVDEAERGEGGVELGQGDPGLDHGDLVGHVDLEDGRHALEGDDDAARHGNRRARQSGAGAAGRDRHAELARPRPRWPPPRRWRPDGPRPADAPARGRATRRGRGPRGRRRPRRRGELRRLPSVGPRSSTPPCAPSSGQTDRPGDTLTRGVGAAPLPGPSTDRSGLSRGATSMSELRPQGVDAGTGGDPSPCPSTPNGSRWPNPTTSRTVGSARRWPARGPSP